MMNPKLNLYQVRFRANPEYELFKYDHLTTEQQQMFNDLQKDEDFYGILCPRQHNGLGIKSVCRNTALLFLSLKEPSQLPRYIRNAHNGDIEEAITQLVLDRIIQIEHNGNFLCGAETNSLLRLSESDTMTGEGVISQLSLAAIKYAESLSINDITRLSARMYFYNRHPVNPQLQHRYPNYESISAYLQLDKDYQIRNTLNTNWEQVIVNQGNDVWLMFKNQLSGKSFKHAEAIYKLYISPQFETIHDIFPILFNIFTDTQISRFKIGGCLASLLRPDKIVCYFQSFEELISISEMIKKTLNGISAQGTPFTANISQDGLLSWGIDPPNNQQILGWQERETWRLWITNKLASALICAKNSKDMIVEPWQFSLQRLKLDGIETKTWSPVKNLWN